MFKYLLFVFIMLFALQSFAVADFYKWEDEEGNIHITDYPPPVKNAKNIEVQKKEDIPKDIFIRPGLEEKGSDSDKQKTDVRRDHEVILYTTSWCPYCTKARNYFTSRNIPFTEYDVERDREAALRKKELDPKEGVPFAIINGNSIHGYSESAYERALRE